MDRSWGEVNIPTFLDLSIRPHRCSSHIGGGAGRRGASGAGEPGLERKIDVEEAAGHPFLAAPLAFHPDPPAVRLDNALADRQAQPQPAAAKGRLAGRVELRVACRVKALENAL